MSEETLLHEDPGNPPEPARGEHTSVHHGTPRRALWPAVGLVTIPIVVLDQISKFWVVGHIRPIEMVTIVPHILDLTYTLNPGAAFSLFANLPPWLREGFLVAISIAAIAVLTVLLVRSKGVTVQAVAFGMILGGALGNLIDRVARGRVVDFIYVHYYGLSYPVFNLADSAITIGVGIILIGLLTEGESKGDSNVPSQENPGRPEAGN